MNVFKFATTLLAASFTTLVPHCVRCSAGEHPYGMPPRTAAGALMKGSASQ